MLKPVISIAFFVVFHLNENSYWTAKQESSIVCNSHGCKGAYTGPEFTDGSDIAHQFSNKMSFEVGNKLKELYKSKHYSKVDFDKIQMSTKGMGSGKVVYELTVPFKQVDEKCEAFTSFDHVGGWNHTPALSVRKSQLEKALLKGEKLHISDLKSTKEGLQEYWIQWKHREMQKECETK